MRDETAITIANHYGRRLLMLVYFATVILAAMLAVLAYAAGSSCA